MATLTTQNDSESARILDKGYTRRLTPDPAGGYTANIMEFPGCFAEGNSADEALANLESAALSWITVALANGRTVRDPISFDGYSGKIALRIPRGLHQQVAELAEMEECSVNQLLTTAISQYVSKVDAIKVLERTVRQTLQSVLPFKVVHFEKWDVLPPNASTHLQLTSPMPSVVGGQLTAWEAKLLPVGTARHG